MKYTSIIVAVGLGLALAAALSATPAQAQLQHTFVSSQGNDANNCSLATPCRHLQAALAATTPGGEIAILNTAGYNGGTTVLIDKAVSIVNPGGFEAEIAPPSGGTGIVISAGASDAVSLRGLTIDGGSSGQTGIQFNTGKSLTVTNCVIRHLTGDGIDFLPNIASSLSVSNTLVADNNNSGIAIAPTGSVSVTAIINRVETNNNVNYGIYVTGSIGTVNATTVSDSVAAGNGYGFYVNGSAATTLTLFHSTAANNGVGITGYSGLIIAQSMVTGNAIGYATFATILSYGDNYIYLNGSNSGGLTPISKQ